MKTPPAVIPSADTEAERNQQEFGSWSKRVDKNRLIGNDSWAGPANPFALLAGRVLSPDLSPKQSLSPGLPKIPEEEG